MRGGSKDSRLRVELAMQSQQVGLHVVSDKKTYVSMIGVFAPERFKERDQKLYPDVYKLKGSSQRGIARLKSRLKSILEARKKLKVICTEKQ